ncbi:twin-arginine translocation signal domain-containing protein [Roseibium denhamense]|uniref:Tat (Twin-arginine translocation) pathway signal sequence n=1 Tax=Roseibium denhamense TaxID=76305 RepID=A0ABY1P3T4_9HYPH|nr:thioredoxin domain-containing protein [Roseibium denhamense]MTI07766.1 twin-arginine translocation signal domain-containing protein [Roseibium denhamense]SMP25301.1 Tat (twin-arginine translocation) pathway signal sequence [Roseibium denhamense]
MTQTRRQFLKTTALVTAFASVSSVLPAHAQDVDLDDLLKPGPLGDKVLGDENAPVTIVEYASMTCGHCANFHIRTWPTIKKDYIETGKVRFIFREFPLDPVAAAAFMLARCAPQDKYFEVVDIMFEEQRSWAFTDNPYQSLLDFSKQIGFTQESFEECLTDQGLLDAVNAVKDRGANEFGVSSTPTFFINGERHPGALSIEQMGEIIEKNL